MFGSPRSSVYGAAKAAVVGLMRSIALDVVGTGIRINAISPIADTAMSDGFFRHFPDLPRQQYTTEVVAPVVAHLCHRDCRLNGKVLSAGGGRTARIATTTGRGLFDPASDHRSLAASIGLLLSDRDLVALGSAEDEFALLPAAGGPAGAPRPATERAPAVSRSRDRACMFTSTMQVDPGSIEQFLAVLGPVFKVLDEQPGCEFAYLVRANRAPATFMLFERWADRATFERFKASDYWIDYMAATEPLYSGERVVVGWHLLEKRVRDGA